MIWGLLWEIDENNPPPVLFSHSYDMYNRTGLVSRVVNELIPPAAGRPGSKAS